jgi:hypothetical protein
MESNGGKIPVRLQRFLRLTAIRRDIRHARVAALILRKGRLAIRQDRLPDADVIGWDIGSALEGLAAHIGIGGFSDARYLGFHDLENIRRYTFEIEPVAGKLRGVRFVKPEALPEIVAHGERKAIMAALKKRTTRFNLPISSQSSAGKQDRKERACHNKMMIS